MHFRPVSVSVLLWQKVQINEIFIVYMLILTYSGITYYFLCYKAFNGVSYTNSLLYDTIEGELSAVSFI